MTGHQVARTTHTPEPDQLHELNGPDLASPGTDPLRTASGTGARYLLPDYAALLSRGSRHLGTGPATELGPALGTLLAAYRALPQRPGTALALGRLDALLAPYATGPEPRADARLATFWSQLGQLPGPGYATVGPRPGPLARALLEAQVPVREIKEEDVNLETAFMRLTKGAVQ